MTDTTASFDGVTLLGGRDFAFGDVRRLARNVLGSAATGLGALAAVGAAIGVATVAGIWMVGVALSGNPHLQARPPAGPARLALVGPAAFSQTSFEAKWARMTAVISASVRSVAHSVETNKVAEAGEAISAPQIVSHPRLKVKHEVSRVREPNHVARLTPPTAPALPRPRLVPETPKHVVARIAPIPLPRPNPARPELVLAPLTRPAPQLAVVAPPPVEERARPREAHNKAPVLTTPIRRTALYDIAGHTVYMPNGERLEAHSGLGNKIDNPHYVKVKMRGPTPPNVYDLKLRERLFHGVRAIRLTPVDDGKMFGRDGMLAHSYMLGPSGQSNGCVSFKHYHRFLRAFLDGKVDRMVVVRRLDDAPPQFASLARAGHRRGYRYAANEVTW